MNDCPDSETLAVFAQGTTSGEEWRAVVRHLADCDLCRRQVALVAEEPPAQLPSSAPVDVGFYRAPTRNWQRVAQAVAAAALIAAGVAWVLVQRPVKTQEPTAAAPTPQPKPGPAPTPSPTIPPPVLATPEAPKPAPSDRPAPDTRPFPPSPAPEIPLPAPSPFLAQRAGPDVSQSVEIAAGAGTVSRLSGDVLTPLAPKTTLLPSDTLLSPAGGSVVLADGLTLHLAADTELRVSWSQTLSCTKVDVRKGDAVVEVGSSPKPLLVASGNVGVHLRASEGRVKLSAGDQSLRATILSGSSQFQTRSGEAKALGARQSLVLRDAGDQLETVDTYDISRFVTLDAAARGMPAPAPVVAPLPPEKRPPMLDVLLTGLGQQSYAYRVTGRQVRDGVYAPPGLFTSTIEEFTAAKRLDEERARLKRGSRPWDDLGKGPLGPRDSRLVEILRASQAPHQMLLELVPMVRGEGAPRSDQVRGRLCLVWDLRLDPPALRGFMEQLLQNAVADGRLEKPDFIYWDTLEGSLECAALKFDPKLTRVVDRRKVSYSYKTVTGLDRRTYQLETVYEFFSHGAAVLPLPEALIKELEGKK